MTQNVPDFADLLAGAQRSAVHLELRDAYSVGNETERFEAWRRGVRLDEGDQASWWRPWLDLVAATVERGVVMRRARVVSEPVSEYIRFEHSNAFTNVAAGEQLRWLPRARASALALPGNDFWLIDGCRVRFNVFSGDGEVVEPQYTEDAAVAQLCASGFEAVWDLGIPHEDYKIS
ncbi:DUF6879 family protein [Streptomyces venezuelae]|uniref:DUF6879 family protein n=1 Tax=Streptomyces venezuelae TaxID=54571 RepID=UPI00331C605A